MAYELLEKELKDLPESNIADVIEYIQFLKFKLLKDENNTDSAIAKRKHPERKLGILQGKFVMADDFDETPDCFKEYNGKRHQSLLAGPSHFFENAEDRLY